MWRVLHVRVTVDAAPRHARASRCRQLGVSRLAPRATRHARAMQTPRTSAITHYSSGITTA